ncbi:MAG: hypothetical protein GWP14_02315 [Actinobacteria bacterium]|nr:hypothetical protein [Actinomycetota bacterium]
MKTKLILTLVTLSVFLISLSLVAQLNTQALPAKLAQAQFDEIKDKTNLLKNGNFEKWQPAPKGWPEGCMFAEGWDTNGAISRSSTTVKDGSFSLTMGSSYGYTWITNDIPLDSCRGKTIVFGAWVKTDAKIRVSISLVGYNGERYTVNDSGLHPGDGQWHFLTVKRPVPTDATGRLRVYFNLRSSLPDGMVYMDGARVVVVDN